MTEEFRARVAAADERLSLYGMLFSLSNRIQAVGDSQFDDITMKQHFLMIVLGMLGAYRPTLNETAQLVGCSYQNVKRMAAQLEKNGYLAIRTDEEDHRKQRLVGTGKFERMGVETQAAGETFMERLYRGIPREDLRQAIQTLKQMDRNMGGTYD